MQGFDIVVVGTGHAGAQMCIALRQGGYEGSIAMIGDEPDLPYERPPLSKEYLSGEKAYERLLIRPARFWADRDIQLLLGDAVITVDADAHVVRTQIGKNLGYGTLIWAAGGTPRQLSSAPPGMGGIHTIRTRADVDCLIAELPLVNRVAIIGGGYIGLEAASAMVKADKQVTLVEYADRVLARVAGHELSEFVADFHRARGVDLRTSTQVVGFEGTSHVSAVLTGNRGSFETDAVIVGIGIDPNIGPLANAGAAVGDGVRVDDHCRTSLPDVYAIGDCASHPNRFAQGRSIRLESVQNANDQATTVARAMLGVAEPYAATPWFWSNQYDLRLQTVGLQAGHDQTVIRGSVADRRFSVIYLRQGAVIALDCVNMVKDYVAGRKLVEAAAVIPPALLADQDSPLKSLLADS